MNIFILKFVEHGTLRGDLESMGSYFGFVEKFQLDVVQVVLGYVNIFITTGYNWNYSMFIAEWNALWNIRAMILWL